MHSTQRFVFETKTILMFQNHCFYSWLQFYSSIKTLTITIKMKKFSKYCNLKIFFPLVVLVANDVMIFCHTLKNTLILHFYFLMLSISISALYTSHKHFFKTYFYDTLLMLQILQLIEQNPVLNALK